MIRLNGFSKKAPEETSHKENVSSSIAEIDPRRRKIVELIGRLRKSETSEEKTAVLSALTDFAEHPVEIIWQVIQGITSNRQPGCLTDRRYLQDLVWKINGTGAGRFFLQQNCFIQKNAYDILTGFNDHAINGVIEGLSHITPSRFNHPRDRAKYIAPLLTSFGPPIMPLLKPYLHSNRPGLSDEISMIIANIHILWDLNGAKAASCFIENEIFESSGSVKIIHRFNDEAMRYLVNNIALLRDQNSYKTINPADSLCKRLIELKEKSLPFLREASKSENQEIADEASYLIGKIEIDT